MSKNGPKKGLRPLGVNKAIGSIMQGFDQLVLILHLDQLQFLIEAIHLQLHSTCLTILKALSQVNKHGFRFSRSFLFDTSAMKNETEWLLKHFFSLD
jgi:hypothetical protein